MTAQSIMLSLRSTHSHLVDKLGVTLSFLCAIHCALVPVFVIFFPSLEILGHTETEVHALLAVVLLGVTILAFYRGYQQHKRKDIVAIAGLGILVVFVALFMHEIDMHTELMSSEASITTIGSAILIIAHILNLKNMACCKSSGCSH